MTSGEAPSRDDLHPGRTVPTLGYANIGRRSYRRAVKIVAIVLAGLGIVFAARWAAPRVITRLNVLRQQKTLMALNRPPQAAVWDEDPAAVAETRRAKPGPAGGYTVSRMMGGADDFDAVRLADPYRADFDAAVGGVPGEFIAFAGSRSAPAGGPRLVVVGGMMASWSSHGWHSGIHVIVDAGRTLQLLAAVIEPGSLASPPKAVGRPAPALGIEVRPGDRLRLYAGQPDPADPSRFTIDYDCNGVRGTLIGTLGPNDTVTLTPSDPSLNPARSGGNFVPAGSKHAATPIRRLD